MDIFNIVVFLSDHERAPIITMQIIQRVATVRSQTRRLPIVQRQTVVVGASSLLERVNRVRRDVLLNVAAVGDGALLGSSRQESACRRATLSVSVVVRRLRRAATVMQGRTTAAHLGLLLVAGTLRDRCTATLLGSALERAMLRLEFGWVRTSLRYRRAARAGRHSDSVAVVGRRGRTEIDLQVVHLVRAAILEVIRDVASGDHHHALRALTLRVLTMFVARVRYLPQVTAVSRMSA